MTSEEKLGRRFHDDMTPLPCGCPTFYLYVCGGNVFCGKCGDRYSHPKDGVAAPIAPAAVSDDAMCDRHWIAGAKWGWNMAVADDKEGFNRAIEQGLKLIREDRRKPSAEGDGTHTKNVESELAIARDLIADMRARIEELTGCNFSDRMWAALKARAEAAEANVRAVSDALAEKMQHWTPQGAEWAYYVKSEVDARDARLRAIVSSVPNLKGPAGE